MGTIRLNNLSLLSFERELLDSLDYHHLQISPGGYALSFGPGLDSPQE